MCCNYPLNCDHMRSATDKRDENVFRFKSPLLKWATQICHCKTYDSHWEKKTCVGFHYILCLSTTIQKIYFEHFAEVLDEMLFNVSISCINYEHSHYLFNCFLLSLYIFLMRQNNNSLNFSFYHGILSLVRVLKIIRSEFFEIFMNCFIC